MHSNNSCRDRYGFDLRCVIHLTMHYWPNLLSGVSKETAGPEKEVRTLSALILNKYQIFKVERKIKYGSFPNKNFQCLPQKKLRIHRISLSANMKNQQLVQWKGYIRIQAKRHTLTYTDTNPVELSWAEIPYQPSKAQLGFHGGKKSTFLHTWKKSFLPPHNNINFLLKEKPEAPLDRIWTKKYKKKQSQEKKKSKFKLQLLKKKYYGCGKSSPKPPSSNQFLLFCVLWKEATTHSLFEVELCYIQQHLSGYPQRVILTPVRHLVQVQEVK